MDMYNYDDPENHLQSNEVLHTRDVAHLREALQYLQLYIADAVMAVENLTSSSNEIKHLVGNLERMTDDYNETMGDDPGRVGSGDPGACDSPAVRLLLRTAGTACLLGRNGRKGTAGSPGLGHGTDKRSGSSTNDAAHNIV